MNKELSTPIIVVIVVVVAIIVAVYGYNALKSPKSNMSGREAFEARQHMIPPSKR